MSSFAPGLVVAGLPKWIQKVVESIQLTIRYVSPATPLPAPLPAPRPAPEAVGPEEQPAGGGSSAAAERDAFLVSDGGSFSNMYVAGLIQRGAKSIVVGVNTDQPLAPRWAWDPTQRNATEKDVDNALASFFGTIIGSVWGEGSGAREGVAHGFIAEVGTQRVNIVHHVPEGGNDVVGCAVASVRAVRYGSCSAALILSWDTFRLQYLDGISSANR